MSREAGKGDANNRVKNWQKYWSEIDRIFKKEGTKDANRMPSLADEFIDKAGGTKGQKADSPSKRLSNKKRH